MLQEASMTPVGPGTKTPPKHNLQEPSSKPSKTTPNLPKTDQQQHNQKTRIRKMTRGKSQKRFTPVRPVKSTGQTGHAWVAQDEQHLWVNSPKSNSRSLDSLHGFAQDFGNSRNTSWALHSQVMVHQNSLNQEESKDFRQEHH
jgi:hypothetical protein